MSESQSSSGGAALAPPRTARDILDRGREFLKVKGIQEFRLDAELLVAHALSFSRLQLFMELERPVDEAEIGSARKLLMRRAKGEPVAYLTGAREFYGREFLVGPGCLIPRPETEHIVDEARAWAQERTGQSVVQRDRALEATRLHQQDETSSLEASESELKTSSEAGSTANSEVWRPEVLDLGTGSGCLAISLAVELKHARVQAVEFSKAALVWARKNAERCEASVDFQEADAFEFLSRQSPRSFDLVVSNPPYVDPADAGSLAREVREFEPSQALFAPGQDVDYWARELVRVVPPLLRPGGLLLIELGAGQGPRVLEAAGQLAPQATSRLVEDLAGIERVLALRLAL